MNTLQQLAPDLWIADQPLRFLGLEIGARMTVIRCAGSRLLLHSPVAHTPELAAQIEQLGSPAFLVAPNRFHHLFVGDWQSAYPTARVYAAPGLEIKRRDLKIDGLLADNPPSDWSAEVDQAVVAGFPLANEVVFLHRPSATLIATDLVFNVGDASPAPTRLAFRLMGAYGRPSSTLLERVFVRNRGAFCRSLERILGWDFSRIVMAHGEVVESGGREALEKAYAWILRGDHQAA